MLAKKSCGGRGKRRRPLIFHFDGRQPSSWAQTRILKISCLCLIYWCLCPTTKAAFVPVAHLPFHQSCHHAALAVAPHSDSLHTRTTKSTNKKRKKINPGASSTQTWRVFGVNVHPDLLWTDETSGHVNNTPTKVLPEKLYLSPPVVEALADRLRLKQSHSEGRAGVGECCECSAIPRQLLDVRLVRRSLDARRHKPSPGGGGDGPRYAYVLDIDISASEATKLKLRHQPGRLERLAPAPTLPNSSLESPNTSSASNKPRVIIVGAGPAGLFCALTLARSGVVTPIVLERGQPVESRGRDIGALMHRRSLRLESNFCFGEGGAGTWSDGKLTTRIGRNSDDVRVVLKTLVQYGAPDSILVEGSPHLGTDNLVRLLRNMRQDLWRLGGDIRFGAKMTKLILEEGVVCGVQVEYSEAVVREAGRDGGKSARPSSQSMQGQSRVETILGDAVVLATGHSARDVYEVLHAAGVKLEAKGFATGFRVEHPQKLINRIQYGSEWAPSVVTGKSTTDNANLSFFGIENQENALHPGRLPVPSYRLATDKAFDGTSFRGAYSFCMCPGGQIVPTSTHSSEVCVNGMSFSKRDSLWANSALVVTVAPDDEILDKYREEHGALAGLAFQKDMERRAAEMGGGNLTVPVQRLTDFVEGQASRSAPPSSYRLGVKPSACHEIYPEPIVTALRDAIVNHFDKRMPGFLCEEGLLHGVETRTSSPVRVSRDPDTLQAIGTERLFPSGEGAGFAGGIVSAAVDGILVAEAAMEQLGLSAAAVRGGTERKARTKSIGFSY